MEYEEKSGYIARCGSIGNFTFQRAFVLPTVAECKLRVQLYCLEIKLRLNSQVCSLSPQHFDVY
jgi:hypothetical protein